MNAFRTASTLMLTTIVVLTTGCRTSGHSQAWSGKFSWKAEEYFDDEVAVLLCRAIQAEDVEEIDKLVAQGADVNKLGKQNMTPLLWAFGGNHETFKRLLEHGADPNAIVQGSFNSRHAIAPGDSVNHLACRHPDKAYFDPVFDHGGDPNLLNPLTQESPLFKVARAGLIDAERRASRLVELGADVNHVDNSWKSVIMVAASWGGQYDLALLLLQKGADHRVRHKKSILRFVHVVAIEEIRRVPHLSPDHQAAHARLVKWLESHGDSIEAAKADIARWEQGEGSPENIKRQMQAELKEFEEKEAQLKRESEEKK